MTAVGVCPEEEGEVLGLLMLLVLLLLPSELG